MNNLELTESEYNKLRDLFRACSFAEHDDTELADFGNHRNLYDYITKELRIDCERGRGTAYAKAKELIEFNIRFKMKTHKDITNPAIRWMFACELLILRQCVRHGDLYSPWGCGIRLGLDTAFRRMSGMIEHQKMPTYKINGKFVDYE